MIEQTAEAVRDRFGLSPGTGLVLRGTAKDGPLETYWAHRKRDGAPGQLAGLGAAAAIGPNFSHFLDVPRTDNLFNRKRQLICLAELSNAGVPVVPHLSAAREADWRFWEGYLQARAGIGSVAAEFQTGNKKRAEGLNVIKRIARIQDKIGRSLHLVIIGGGQFVEEAARCFQTFTLIDSKPFMNAVWRRSFAGGARTSLWKSNPLPLGTGIDELLAANVEAYSAWILERSSRTGSARAAPASSSLRVSTRAPSSSRHRRNALKSITGTVGG